MEKGIIRYMDKSNFSHFLMHYIHFTPYFFRRKDMDLQKTYQQVRGLCISLVFKYFNFFFVITKSGTDTTYKQYIAHSIIRFKTIIIGCFNLFNCKSRT